VEGAGLGVHQYANNHTGYDGHGFIDMVGEGDLRFEFDSSGARYDLDVRYALAKGQRPLDVLVDGYYVDTLDFAATGSWTNWGKASMSLDLDEGAHVLTLRTKGSSGANIDSLCLAIDNENSETNPTDGQGNTPIRIEAEDYSSFLDNSAGNSGGAYRQDDVDIQNTSDQDGGFNVGWVRAGEWLEYTLDLSAGTYAATARVASAFDTGAFSLTMGGQTSDVTAVANSGGWQNWQTIELGEFTVPASDAPAVQRVRLDVHGDRFNVNWLAFEKVDTLADQLAGDHVTMNAALASAMASMPDDSDEALAGGYSVQSASNVTLPVLDAVA